jgi:serine/threonine-protein kinase
MAEVFLARQSGPEGFDRRVAVKRILPHLVDADDFVQMFLAEARLAARLTHPNITHIYEFGKVDEHYFIAMEYVKGVHAGLLIKHGSNEPLPPALVARIGADACAGLHFAHELTDASGRRLEIVHRDVSPPNLMVSFDGVVKLVDFGIAKAVSQVEQTRPGVVKGKYAYMSPEQTTAQTLDGRSDVFSLGLVLWELLAGRVMLSRTDPVEVMKSIRDGRLPSIESVRSDIPPALATALNYALQVKRENRPSAAELGNMLESYIKSSPELGTSLWMAQWIRQRFPGANVSGSQPALPGGTAAATVGTLAATVGTAPATVATSTAMGTGTTRSLGSNPAVPGVNTDITHEVEDATEVIRNPPPFMTSPEMIATATRASVAHSAFSRRGRIGRILMVAGVAMIIGFSAMMLLRGTPDDEGDREPRASVSTTIDADAPAAAPIDAAPEPASLEVITTPPGARVGVAGQSHTLQSPARLTDLPAGPVKIAIVLEGYERVTRVVKLKAGQDRTMEFQLVPLPPPEVDAGIIEMTPDEPPPKRHPVMRRPKHRGKGWLTVRTNPYSVVYLHGRRIGTTPFAAVKLPAGRHLLTFKNPKRKAYRRRVLIRPNKTTKLNFRLP